MTKEEKGWGGQRSGAGRKSPPGGRRKPRAFSCNDHEWALILEAATKAGYESASAYIRDKVVPR